MSETKWVYRFGGDALEGSADMVQTLGNKGANLAEMARMGLPVPPGFTVSTEACRDYLTREHELRDVVRRQITEALDWLGDVTNSRFGDPDRPLLVSVRSGAPVSMPGMMDTVLNLGLNDETAVSLAQRTGSEGFIFDCYRRLIQMYGVVVLGLDDYLFEDVLEEFTIKKGLSAEKNLGDDDLQALLVRFQQLVELETGEDYPQDVHSQFEEALGAVFRSWFSSRAVTYRAINEIDDSVGTAITVQAMVFGNMSEDSATGVVFTRNPSTGEPGLYGEYLPQAQGEDIVGGLHSPLPITEKGRLLRGEKSLSLQSWLPDRFAELEEVGRKLEARFRDMQDIEFTIEAGKLWLLQTRTGKRTTEAAIRIALDLLDEGVVTAEQALRQVPLAEFGRMVRPVVDPDCEAELIASGLPASPGAATGVVAFTSKDAVELAAEGQKVVLVRNETNPDDVKGMHAACALLTRRGGMTSHAALIARAMERPCIVNASALQIQPEAGRMKVGDKVILKGDEITIDGTGGRVLAGKARLKAPEMSPHAKRFKALMEN